MYQLMPLVLRPNCSSTSNHSSGRPALAAVLGGVRPPAQAGLEGGRADALHVVVGQRAARPFGLLLEGDQDLVDVATARSWSSRCGRSVRSAAWVTRLLGVCGGAGGRPRSILTEQSGNGQPDPPAGNPKEVVMSGPGQPVDRCGRAAAGA